MLSGTVPFHEDSPFGASDGPLELSGHHPRRKRRLDPVDLAVANVTPEGQETEKVAREKFLATAKDVMASLLADLTPDQSARRLFQIGEFTEVVRQGMRALGQYDFPEHRRRFRQRELSAVSDTETVGAVAMNDGMAAMQASMRTKQIADLSGAIKSLTELRKAQPLATDRQTTTAQIEALQKELNVLVATIPAASLASRVRSVPPPVVDDPVEPKIDDDEAQSTDEKIDAEFEPPPVGIKVTGRFSGRRGTVEGVTFEEGKVRLHVAYEDAQTPSRVTSPLSEWTWTNEDVEKALLASPSTDSDGPEEPKAPPPPYDEAYDFDLY